MSDEEIDAYPPWNFSWVIPNQLAAMAFPRNKENLRFLVNEGIKHLITLSPEKQPPITEIPELNWTMIDVDEFEAPSMKNIKDFIDICKRCSSRNEAVGVHCRQGRGRTGVMLACHFMVFQKLGPDQAITNVRLLRKGSCETPEQERAVHKYHDCLTGLTKIDLEEVNDKAKLIKEDDGVKETNGE